MSCVGRERVKFLMDKSSYRCKRKVAKCSFIKRVLNRSLVPYSIVSIIVMFSIPLIIHYYSFHSLLLLPKTLQ